MTKATTTPDPPESGDSPAPNRAVRVFLSYAWEDEAYKLWVRRLATRLREDGVDARLDLWHTREGETVAQFMIREVRLAHRVLVLCSPQYRARVHAMEDGQSGGGAVGWEAMLLTSAMFHQKLMAKPLVVLTRGTRETSVPDFLQGFVSVYLTDDARAETEYHEMLRRLLGKTDRPPPLGTLPAGLDPEPVTPLRWVGRDGAAEYTTEFTRKPDQIGSSAGASNGASGASESEATAETDPELAERLLGLLAANRNPILLLAQQGRSHGTVVRKLRRCAACPGPVARRVLDFSPPADRDAAEGQYFGHLARCMGLEQPVQDAVAWREAMEDQLARGQRLLLLVSRLEKGSHLCAAKLAGELRALLEDQDRRAANPALWVVFCGGEHLHHLYEYGDLSMLNDAKVLPVDEFSPRDLASLCSAELSRNQATLLLDESGGHPTLMREAADLWTTRGPVDRGTLRDHLSRTPLLGRAFRPLRDSPEHGPALRDLLAEGETHLNEPGARDRVPYIEDPLLRGLYWRNLLCWRDDRLVWRSPAILQAGRRICAIDR